jgi:hypothetical protein
MGRHLLTTPLLLLGALTVFCSSAASAEVSEESSLAAVIHEAERSHRLLTDQVADCTCTLVKRERINGQVLGHEYAEVKIRHRQIRSGRIVVPFSVYMKFLAPAEVQGREVIYVEGRNDGKLIVRRGGRRFAYVTTSIDPLGELALERNRYPITHVGLQSMIEELLVVAQEELQNPAEELLCRKFDEVKIDGRVCHMFQFTHPVRRDRYRYHIARIYVDEELDLPIRHESYDWPDEEGGQPKLLEEYTYLNLRLNVGLTDWDFDHRNEEYDFLKEFQP